MSKVLFIVKKRIDEYGKSYGLINSAKFVSNFLNSKDIESKVVEVIDSNSIDKEVTAFNPTHVMIEALWVTPDKFKELLKIQRHQNRHWVVRIHSKLPFLAHEGNAIKWINEYTEIAKITPSFQISANHIELVEALDELKGTDNLYLPNIYQPESVQQSEKQNKDHIGCFGAIRPMKNHLIQAAAAIEFGNNINKKIHFHINANRIEQKGENILKNLVELFNNTQHELVFHDWMEHNEFIKLVKTMDFGTQVSLSETYNIVAADFASNKIPIIVSPDIEWMPGFAKVNPNSLEDICAKYTQIHYYNWANYMGHISKWFLSSNDRDSKLFWLDYLVE